MSGEGETCKRGHALTPANTYTRPNGVQECRQCVRERLRGDGLERGALTLPRTPAVLAALAWRLNADECERLVEAVIDE